MADPRFPGRRRNIDDPYEPPSRMAPRVAPAIPDPYASGEEAKARRVLREVKRPQRQPVTVRVRTAADDQFKVRVSFSRAHGADAGQVWSEPLQLDPDEDAGKEFYWRTEIDQFRVEPLLQGFRTTWRLLTAGWRFADGLRWASYDEAISNPLAIVRVIRAPAVIPSSPAPLFRVTITSKYRP